MAQNKQDSTFTITDRRLFTSEGELRNEASQETVTASPTPEPPPPQPDAPPDTPPVTPPAPAQETVSALNPDAPPTPTAAEQQVQAEAYRKSAKDLDTRVELSGHSAQELQITFERFMASLYMSAMVHLGLMHPPGGQPQVDMIGARQTIDTLGMIADKTKGNLSPTEINFLENCLYELRMAYVEVTNAVAHPLQSAPGDSPR